jgi:hypothetical protein
MIGFGSDRRRRCFVAAAGALTALLCAGPAVAQEFPVHPMALTFPGEGTTHDFVKAAPVSGGFVAAWNRVTDGKTSVLIRRFAADGAQVSDLTVIEDGALAASPVEGRPDVVNLGGDRIGVVWMAAGQTLKGAVYDAATGQLSDPIKYFSKGALANVPHGLALMKNGRVAMVTRRAVRGGEETTLFILDQSMAQVGASEVVERDESGHSKSGVFDQAVVANRSGAMVIYRATDQRLMQRWFDGAVLSSPDALRPPLITHIPGSPVYNAYTITAKALPNGGYAAAVEDLVAHGHYDFRTVYVRGFTPKGGLLRRSIYREDVSYGHLADHVKPGIFVFDQGFGVGWRHHPRTPGSVTQRAGFFDLDRKELSQQVITEYFGADGPSGVENPGDASEFVRLPNGDSVRLFIADRRIYGDRIPAATVGQSDTKGGDKIVGTPGADVLLGGRGDDRIRGGDGDDIIDGGDQFDYVHAGKGDDLIIAEDYLNPHQKIKGGPGADVFVIRASSVNIMNFEKSDRLDVSGFNYKTREEALANAVQRDGCVYIRFEQQLDGLIITQAAVYLYNYKLKNLTAANIIN